MWRRWLIAVFCVSSVFLILFGCGYHFNLSGTSLRGGLHTLAIPTVQSSSTLAGLEGDFTNIIRREFLSHSTIPIVSRKRASAVLVGKIERVDTSPLSYDIQKQTVGGTTVSYETTSLRRIRVKMSIKMVNKGTGQVLWEDHDMEEKASYTLSNDPVENQYRERAALKEIARLLAKRIYLKTVDAF